MEKRVRDGEERGGSERELVRKEGRVKTVRKMEEGEWETGGEELRWEGVWKERKRKGRGQGRKKEEGVESGRGERKGEKRVEIKRERIGMEGKRQTERSGGERWKKRKIG